jgi:ATP-dependent DNA helicase RecQ
MAIHYPITIQELQNMTGVGAGKAQKFGKEFVALIDKYVKENEIERPMDLVVKSVVNKSGLKVHIIQSIDRKLGLDVIADGKGIEMNDLLKEIEAIVNSGTKLNLDYYINEVIDEDRQEEIYTYFKEEAEDESVETALKELGEDEYTEEDIRLMRIKFFSNEGN